MTIDDQLSSSRQRHPSVDDTLKESPKKKKRRRKTRRGKKKKHIDNPEKNDDQPVVFEFKIHPQDTLKKTLSPESYLSHVRQEANSAPFYVTDHNIDQIQFENEQTLACEPINEHAPFCLELPLDSYERVIEQFLQDRHNLQNDLSKPVEQKNALPDRFDWKAWKNYMKHNSPMPAISTLEYIERNKLLKNCLDWYGEFEGLENWIYALLLLLESEPHTVPSGVQARMTAFVSKHLSMVPSNTVRIRPQMNPTFRFLHIVLLLVVIFKQGNPSHFRVQFI
mmetsp:Transcript_6924/g.10127  ORF Transcript_6924/g.10127 Transcript_6924/m.10127 type:complete len:280 (+) Transcript_6924:44-883(+)